MNDHYYDLMLDSGGTIIARSQDGLEREKNLVLNGNDSKLLQRLLRAVEADNPQADDFRDLGELLFQILLGDELNAHFQVAIERAKGRHIQLLLSLNPEHYLNGFRTAALPWEFLYHEPFGFLATHKEFTLSRYTLLNAPPERPLDQLPLRVLFVGAKPCDLGFVFADPAKEALAETLQGQISMDQVQIENLERPNRASLITKINEFQPHVLHFMGHGRFEELNGGAIALVDPEDTESIWLSESEIDALFQQCQPHVVVLVACEGAKESVQAKVASLAQAIVAKNIQVVGMRFELQNQVAMAFTRAFYQALAEGEPLDVATQAARAALYGADPAQTTRDFGGVVLYMRSANGIIVPSKNTQQVNRPPVPPPPVMCIQDAIAAYKRHIDLEWRGGVDAAGKVEVDGQGKPRGEWIELETHPDFNNASQQPE